MSSQIGFKMDSENITDPYEDNRNVSQSRHSLRSTEKDSQQSSFEQHKSNCRDKIWNEGEKGDCAENRSKTRIWRADPDQDQVSDGEAARSSRSCYSEDCQNESRSEGSISPYSQSRTPSPTPPTGLRAKRVSCSPLHKTGGVGRQGGSCPERLGVQPLRRRRVVHSQNKGPTPHKDLDLVAKRMLSARLLKINELHNVLAELQQRIDELQKENRILKQLQVRQEKALRRYDDTENEISQLMARHNNETHVLRERLRRSQERERAAEQQLKDRGEQLHQSQATNARLKKLVDQRELGARDELSRKLQEEKARSQQAEGKIKDLERNMELSTSSYKRQLAAERKRSLSAQEEIGALQEELERLTNKLKGKERELDAKNIYANRMTKPPLRNNVDSGAKRKVLSRSSIKAVQIKDRLSDLDFPTPPPAIADANECSERAADEYLSLKELERADRHAETEQQRMRDQDQEKELVKEKQHLNWEPNVLEEKAPGLRDGCENEQEEERVRKRLSLLVNQEENDRKHGHVQEEVRTWNQDALANQQAAEEARRKKEQLLADMREIDDQNRRAQDTVFAEFRPFEFKEVTNSSRSPRSSVQGKHSSSIFNLTESEESVGRDDGAGSREGRRRRSGTEGGTVTTGGGWRAMRPPTSGDDLAFGGYAPSFGNSVSGGFSGFPPPPPGEDRDSAIEAIGVLSLRGVEAEKGRERGRGVGKDKKSRLMQELFGAMATAPSDSVGTFNKLEVLNSSPATDAGRSRREGLLSFNSGSSTPPASSLNTLHVADCRPAVCAITSFDDDIEELAL